MLISPEELLRKIRLGEDSVLELKTVAFRGDRVVGPKREDLADELAAMANTADGVCILGVDDKSRAVVGIPIDRLDLVEAFVRDICNDSIRPPLLVGIVRLELPDETGEQLPVLRVDVPRSLFVHESPGGYFHRQGSAKRKLPPDQLARLFQQRSQARIFRFEEQPVPDSGPEDLEERLWQKFLGPLTDGPRSTLHKLDLLTHDDSGRERATVAGVLFCTGHPERWLPGAYIEAVRYRGNVQDSHYQVDAKRITGPLDEQIRETLIFARRNTSVAAVKEPARREIPQFSERAVFEAIVNAVAHRDYSIAGSKIRLFMFDDRLELYSPGALPNSVTLETLPWRQATRNELLTSLLARCPVGDHAEDVHRRFFMEKRGDGVPIILRETEALSGRRPEYRLLDDELLLTLPAAQRPD